MKHNLVRLSVLGLLIFGVTVFVSQVLPAQAATAEKVDTHCSWASVSGKIEQSAPYVRISVVRADDLTHKVGEAYTHVRSGGRYSKTFFYTERQPKGTALVMAVCESDGSQCIRPATMFGTSCQ